MEIGAVFELVFMLVAVHCLCDYSLQNDFIAHAKNNNTALGKLYWKWVLPGHGLIHGLGVYIVTGSIVFGIIETILHTLVDHWKNQNYITFNTDQTIHIVIKLWYVAVIYYYCQ